MGRSWKSYIEEVVADEYPGVKIKWKGDNPTLIIPDELENNAPEIVEYTIAVWKLLGGEVVFYPEKATHVDNDCEIDPEQLPGKYADEL